MQRSNPEVYKMVADNIKRVRLEKGLTQKQLAKETNLSLSCITRIESGKYDMRTTTIHAILKVLKVPFHEIMSEYID